VEGRSPLVLSTTNRAVMARAEARAEARADLHLQIEDFTPAMSRASTRPIYSFAKINLQIFLRRARNVGQNHRLGSRVLILTCAINCSSEYNAPIFGTHSLSLIEGEGSDTDVSRQRGSESVNASIKSAFAG